MLFQKKLEVRASGSEFCQECSRNKTPHLLMSAENRAVSGAKPSTDAVTKGLTS